MRQARGVLWGLGAHVIKTGLSPIIIDLMERGFVSALAMNGAVVIHDFELALSGSHVRRSGRGARAWTLRHGGRDRPPAERRDQRRRARGARDWAGGGPPPARTRRLRTNDSASLLPRPGCRFLSRCTLLSARTSFTCTRDASGAALGEGSLRDFRFLVSNVARLAGGVYLNCGSAVVLPEVFLKAVALARNRGISLDGLTTVNLDFMRLYRPQTNVVTRPTAGIGKGYSLVGHHEIMIPLLAAAMVEASKS